MTLTQVSRPANVAGGGPPREKPRILFLIDEIGGIAEGGTERQVLQLIELAHRLGYEPRLAVLRGTEWLTEQQAGCPIYFAGVFRLTHPAGWSACKRLVRWIREERIALVQTFFVECNLLGPWLARMAHVPVVIGSRRNLTPWGDYPFWMGPALWMVQRLTNLRVDGVAANSLMVAEEMFRKERIPREKLHVVYNGIDLTKFSELGSLRAQARQMLNVGEDEILVGNISCMRPIKGVPQFIEAARMVVEQDRHIRFIAVGDGEQYALVQQLVRRYGLEDHVHLAGVQTDVFPYLAAMDIGVLSSLAEGFSNSLLEYMASGLPSIATDVGGNREALRETGLLVPPEDPTALAEAILKLRSAAIRRQMGQAARRRVEQFSLSHAEKRMEELYGRFLQAKGIFAPER